MSTGNLLAIKLNRAYVPFYLFFAHICVNKFLNGEKLFYLHNKSR